MGGFAIFFAIEVGARGYCAKSVGTFLRAIGFPPKLSKSSNPQPCSETVVAPVTTVSVSTQCNLPTDLVPHLTIPPPPFQALTSSLAVSSPVGLVNHGNTCYINSILQVLQVFHVSGCQVLMLGLYLRF